MGIDNIKGIPPGQINPPAFPSIPPVKQPVVRPDVPTGDFKYPAAPRPKA